MSALDGEAVVAESEAERRKRRHQRTLFDGIAQLYQETRPGYPESTIEFIAATAGLRAGSAVLEIGCGTGQLTRGLASRGLDLTAIDIGPAMIAAAGHAVGDAPVSFQVTSFEDFSESGGPFDLIVSAAAFHWIDPAVKYAKSARLLRPGGWLAVVGNADDYDEPFGSALRDMWIARDVEDGAWVSQRTGSASFGGLFGEPVQRTDEEQMVRAAEAVIGLENTRATSLSWPDEIRRDFTAELRARLKDTESVPFTLRTVATMAQVLPVG
jgi:SAM-dependent methyltransferase